MSLRYTEPVPSGSKMDLLVAKAQYISKADGTSIITYLRKGEKLWSAIRFHNLVLLHDVHKLAEPQREFRFIFNKTMLHFTPDDLIPIICTYKYVKTTKVQLERTDNIYFGIEDKNKLRNRKGTLKKEDRKDILVLPLEKCANLWLGEEVKQILPSNIHV
ncbi:hypothetical protein WISP_27584 [Willisornis vidua]|uniref:Uncharacterized protein n=1 Tax=Willisornis vidua TaxID=1566151 RepID=A0ABQ9DPA2_9PASS|nr:hypothetical protein WISP_27584 [Willisornis vidua]